MLRKLNINRTPTDNLQLGVITAFVSGMVNIASLLLFFAFSSNVTGHFAILAAEIVQGDWYQMSVVFSWIFLFMIGSFTANFIVIRLNKINTYLAHALPLVIEIICLLGVGIYGDLFYAETLAETELLMSIMLFSMGLQNGLTASISNFSIKTTHLTGITTDLGILFSMLMHPDFKHNKEIKIRCQLLLSIMIAYVTGGILSGLCYYQLYFKLFYVVAVLLSGVIAYDLYRVRITKFIHKRQLQTSLNTVHPSRSSSWRNWSIKAKKSLTLPTLRDDSRLLTQD